MRAHPFTRDALRRLGELFVLTGFAVAQPLLDVLGKGADVFVFRQAGRGDIVQLLLIVLFGPALALWAVECLAGLVRELWARTVHLAFVGLLFTVIGVELVKNLVKVPALAVVVVALAFGVALMVLYARSTSFRLWLRYALVAPVAFALLFAFGTPVKSQLLPQASSGRPGATTAAGGTSSVVMVVLDEFPLQSLMESDGTIDPKLYPNFAALAESSNFYRNTTTNAWYTPFAVPALLTGRYPEGRRVPTVSEYPDNLFTMFGADYHRNVHELLHLCPNRLCGHTKSGLGESGLKPLLKDSAKAFRGIVNPRDENIDEANQFVEETEHDDEADAADAAAAERLGNPRSFGLDPKSLKANQPTRFTDFLGSLDGKHPKSVNFLHILMPHSPWRFTPNGARYTAPEPAPGLVKGEWVKEPRPVEIARQRHVVQVRYLDGLIGQLTQRLKATGMWDRATIVITSDHGISFTPGSRKRGATDANYDEIAWVPLFVKTPGQAKGAASDENAQSIDVLPTIADAMGVQLPFPVDGRSLLSGEDRPLAEPRTFYREPEKILKLDGVAGFARMKERTVTQFARSDDPDLRLYRVGPYGTLVGQDVTSLPAGAPAGRVTLREREAYRVADPKKELPAFGYGTSDDESLRGKQIAIAVNGVIGTIGPAFEFNGKTAFGGILPEQLFKAGANDVTVYLVDTTATPTLRPLEIG